MKKLFYLFALILFCFSVIACGRTDDSIIGKWDDNIQLSQKIANVNANSNTINIRTQSTDWWLNGISLNGFNADLTGMDKHSKNFVYSTSEYQVERKEDGKSIVITVNANNTDSDRTLLINLQNGDYFDVIKVVQSR